MGACERCKKPHQPKKPFELMDYCNKCSKNLCATCMANGCCGVKPAESGMKADYEDDTDDPDPPGFAPPLVDPI